jgi:teichuronic acid biosynthesis glycosyltransferase TuaH
MDFQLTDKRMEDSQQSLNFIIISQQPWDTEIGSNCKNIAVELSKSHKVLYVNSPLDRITLWKNFKDAKVQKRISVIKGKSEDLIQIDENLWTLYPDCLVESINWINNALIFDALNQRNNKMLSKSIQKAVNKLHFNEFVLLNDNEMFKGFYLKEYLKPLASAYYSRDYMIAVDYWKKHGERLEPKLIAKSDLCFANSIYLADYCGKHNSHSYYVGQGCDIEDFKTPNLKVPDDLKRFNGKIIGYVGSLNSQRLDIAVIEFIAWNFTDHHIVLVGPEDDDFKLSNLHAISNVHFLGQKPVSDLPAYVNAFDICINPQVVNEITIGNYPRKIDEYLAAGKPVVATKTTTMEVFKDHVYLAGTKEEFITQINRALTENGDALILKRLEFVSTHTWKNSVALMINHIHYLLNKKG